eukprot:gene18672-29141_t
MVFGNEPYRNHTMNTHSHGGMKHDERGGRTSFQNTAERTYTGKTLLGNWVEKQQQQDLDNSYKQAQAAAANTRTAESPYGTSTDDEPAHATPILQDYPAQPAGWWDRPLSVQRATTAGARITPNDKAWSRLAPKARTGLIPPPSHRGPRKIDGRGGAASNQGVRSLCAGLGIQRIAGPAMGGGKDRGI